MADYYRKKQPSCTTPDGREWFASGGGNTNPEYIEREAMLAGVEKRLKNPAIIGWLTSIIADIPAADVVPVVHGRWERTADGAAYCTACKRKMNPSQYGYAFCGLCGARMDGE